MNKVVRIKQINATHEWKKRNTLFEAVAIIRDTAAINHVRQGKEVIWATNEKRRKKTRRIFCRLRCCLGKHAHYFVNDKTQRTDQPELMHTADEKIEKNLNAFGCCCRGCLCSANASHWSVNAVACVFFPVSLEEKSSGNVRHKTSQWSWWFSSSQFDYAFVRRTLARSRPTVKEWVCVCVCVDVVKIERMWKMQITKFSGNLHRMNEVCRQWGPIYRVRM